MKPLLALFCLFALASCNSDCCQAQSPATGYGCGPIGPLGIADHDTSRYANAVQLGWSYWPNKCPFDPMHPPKDYQVADGPRIGVQLGIGVPVCPNGMCPYAAHPAVVVAPAPAAVVVSPSGPVATVNPYGGWVCIGGRWCWRGGHGYRGHRWHPENRLPKR